MCLGGVARPNTSNFRIIIRGLRPRGALELCQVDQGFFGALAAHLFAGAQADAHRRSVGMAEQAAAVIRGQLRAADPGWLPIRHAGDRGRDRQCDAARPASYPAFH